MTTKLVFLLLFFSAICNAQINQFSEDFNITKPDLEQNIFYKDSTANALMIYEVGKSWVDDDYKLNTQINRKLKILNNKGFNKSTVAVYLYDNNKGRKEQLKDIKATVYNIKNGEITTDKLDESDIFEEEYDKNYTIMKFTFPNIQEGSVINYSYRIVSPFMYKYKDWDFQDDIPKLYSEYNASIPGNWDYNIKLVGGQKLAMNTSKLKPNCLDGGNGAYANCGEYVHIMKDIPAFVAEDHMTTKANYLARIEYELKTFSSFDGRVDQITKTWETTDEEIKRDTELGRELRKSSTVKKLLSVEIKTEKNLLEKAKSIYKFIQDTYKWNGEYRVFEDVSFKDLTEEKSGNIGQINGLLHNLLQSEGIDVKPVLISTRQNGLVTKLFPVVSDFNYLIVKATIDGKTYLLDASDDFLFFGQLPFRCLNQYGRLMDFDNESTWININVNDFSTIVYTSKLELNQDLRLNGQITSKLTGYHAFNSKKEYFKNKSSYLSDFENEYSSIEFDDHEVATQNTNDEDFISSFEVTTSLDAVGNKVYLNPFLLKFFKENPFKLQERSYPIDFGYKDVFFYRSELKIAPSFDIIEIPNALKLGLPDGTGSFVCNFKKVEHTVQIYFKLSFNQAIYEPEFYDALKATMAAVVDVQKNALIVLERKQ